VTVYRWVHRFAPEFAEAAAARRRIVGDRWHVDETYLKVNGTWRCLSGPSTSSARPSTCTSHLAETVQPPADSSTERLAGPGSHPQGSPLTGTGYPRVLDELLPATFHCTEAHANNLLETDQGRLKGRLRPMRGLKRDRTARVIIVGHAFIQNLPQGASTTSGPTCRLPLVLPMHSPNWPRSCET
jgi:hypothetical protein